jgi:hypothetical protein
MESGKTTFSKPAGLVPNPKARLREQLRAVMRFKQFSLRIVRRRLAVGFGTSKTLKPNAGVMRWLLPSQKRGVF